jgi:tight adherence protein C
MLHAVIESVRHHLMGYTYAVMLSFIAVGMVMAMRVAMVSWRDVTKLDQEQHGLRDRMLRPLSERIGPRDAIAIRELRLQLVRAGLRSDNAVERYTTTRVLSLCAAGGWSLLVTITGADALHVLTMGGLAFLAAQAGPDLYVQKLTQKRQAAIAQSLPMMTDLMVLCLDVGLSIEAAFERVTAELKTMEPLMAEEASLMLSEMQAGLTFAQALKRMAERIGLDDLTTLSRLISQASQLGASVAQALREYSESSFQKRMMSLEERAGAISSMMTMPITVCMLPAAMVALIGPAIILLVRTFQHL